MDKDTKKDDRVTIRLPEELRNYEALGFKSMTDYIKEALFRYNEKENFEVIKTANILEKISKLISIMEVDRDYTEFDYDIDKEELLDALYRAADALASTNIMEQNALNYIPYPEELKDPLEENPEKHYKYSWAITPKK